MFGYDNLANFYNTQFAMMQFHHYSLSDLENMVPWERHIYLDLLQEHIRKQEEERRDRAALNRRQK